MSNAGRPVGSVAGSENKLTVPVPAGLARTRLEVKDPEKFGKVLGMLADGVPAYKIRKILKMDYYTVTRIQREYASGDIETWKQVAAEKAQQGAEMALDRVYEHLNDDELMAKEKLKDKSITYAIMKDKEILLKGEATSRSETKQGASVDDAMAVFEAAVKEVKGEAIDV